MITENDHKQKLYEAFAALKSAKEAEEFLADLCTPMEINAMADRWRSVPLIIQHKPYRQIYEETGISVTTVGRVARSIEFGTGGYKLIYERITKKPSEKKSITHRYSKKRSVK